MHTAGSHLHAREVDTEQARIRAISRRPRNVVEPAFRAAVAAAASRTTTIEDTAKRLGIKPETVRRYVRAGKLAATRDESGRITGIYERSLCDYRTSAAAGRRRFAACRFRTAAAYAARAA
jgi:excisionase family DNA binding protein